MDEVVYGLDGLDDDLVRRINVSFGMDVICHIQETAGVVSQMFGHAVPQRCSVAWC